MSPLTLGLGLIGIGRPWPSPTHAVVTQRAAEHLLAAAVGHGIRTFDTAPAYGLSERRLGAFLDRLGATERARLVVATKAGETWSAEAGSTVDHSLRGLERSVETSLALLGRVDVLQLHKGTAADVADDRLVGWLVECRARYGIARIGFSASSVDALEAAVARDCFDVLQFPANSANPAFADAFRASAARAEPYLNRPMASGALAAGANPFAYHVRTFASGTVLSGTTNVDHLASNVASFAAALAAGPEGAR